MYTLYTVFRLLVNASIRLVSLFLKHFLYSYLINFILKLRLRRLYLIHTNKPFVKCNKIHNNF